MWWGMDAPSHARIFQRSGIHWRLKIVCVKSLWSRAPFHLSHKNVRRRRPHFDCEFVPHRWSHTLWASRRLLYTYIRATANTMRDDRDNKDAIIISHRAEPRIAEWLTHTHKHTYTPRYRSVPFSPITLPHTHADTRDCGWCENGKSGGHANQTREDYARGVLDASYAQVIFHGRPSSESICQPRHILIESFYILVLERWIIISILLWLCSSIYIICMVNAIPKYRIMVELWVALCVCVGVDFIYSIYNALTLIWRLGTNISGSPISFKPNKQKYPSILCIY